MGDHRRSHWVFTEGDLLEHRGEVTGGVTGGVTESGIIREQRGVTGGVTWVMGCH